MPAESKPFVSPHIVRVVVLFVLVVVAQIPILMIDGLIRERQSRRDLAVEDVASKWGRQQSLSGPMLVIPYRTRTTVTAADGKTTTTHVQLHHATFLPERLGVRGQLDVESRRRGIFSVPVYRTQLDVAGDFAKPSFAAWEIPDADIEWDRAQVVFGVSDIRALEAPAKIRWNGAEVELLPGPGDAPLESGVHAEVALARDASSFAFAAPMRLKGSTGVYWTPLGKVTSVTLRSNWSNPSFQGNWLPDRHSVTGQGFEAEWTIPYLGRNFPQSWRAGGPDPRTLESTRFGVDLIQTVDHYRMAARSVKYAALFLLLTFATLWLVEVLCAVRVHPIQYLLVGSAMCVFYLLELSLSEHLGFGMAYVVATAAVVAQITAYSVSVLGSWRPAAILGGMVTALYGYLYVVLTNEDYALLIGSIGVFALLATIMRLTRRVDWHGGSGAGPRSPAEATEGRRAA